MAGLGDLLGAGDAVRQLFLWSIANQIIGALAAPYFEILGQDVLAAHPDTVLSPAQLADMVVRNFIGADEAAGEARRSGIDAARFTRMVHAAGDAPSPGDLATALRRGTVSEQGTGPESTSFEQGIAEGRLADKWAPVIKALAKVWPTPADILDAIVKGQVDPDQGRADFETVGGDPRWFQLLLDTVGEGPSPGEAAVAARRGIIPWDGTGPGVTSFEQAVRESHFRNKWQAVYRSLSQYLPPPRTITAMIGEGALTDTQGAQLLAEQGLPQDLIQSYLDAAHHQKTAASKQLTVAAVLQLFEAGLVDDATAGGMLTALHYTTEEAGLELGLAQLRRAISELNTAVARVRSLYVAHKISREEARNALTQLQLPNTQTGPIVATWDIEASVNVKTLTTAEITAAYELGIFTQDQATAELTGQGYTPFDAWALLSIKAKKALPGQPANRAAPPATGIAAGTT